jgi:hypothetical protein
LRRAATEAERDDDGRRNEDRGDERSERRDGEAERVPPGRDRLA